MLDLVWYSIFDFQNLNVEYRTSNQFLIAKQIFVFFIQAIMVSGIKCALHDYSLFHNFDNMQWFFYLRVLGLSRMLLTKDAWF